MIDDKKVLEAIDTIENFLDTQGRFLATSIWQSHDGTQLKTDWGYFDDGMRAIKKYIDKREPKGFVADEWYRDTFKGGEE